jgi:alpha-beta hydrolase superfamily lysophospholipase
MTENTTLENRLASFPIGYYELHPDVSVNYQMNRFYNWVGDTTMLTEMREAAVRVQDYPTFAQIFLDLGEKFLAQGQTLKGAYYLRLAEFFLFASDERKQPTRLRFVQLLLDYYQISQASHSRIPYESGWLSAYRFTPEQPKGTIAVFGGFDSYIEEWLPAAFALRDAGYEVVLFEGPGQGSALEDAQVTFIPEWEKPVKAVLDFFHLDDVTLMGFSLGGGLAIRAAAFEPRVQRIIAYDILTDFLEVNLRSLPAAARAQVTAWLESGSADALNAFMAQVMTKSLLAKWGIQQGLHVTGCQTPYELLQVYRQYRTTTISANVTQDVLLMAGAGDHYVPVSQFSDQIATLKNVRSLTARLFTSYEQAQNHCQVGNFGLALRTIIEWIDSLQTRDEDLAAQR